MLHAYSRAARVDVSAQPIRAQYFTNNLLGHGDNIKVHINVKFGNLIRSRFHKKSIAMTSTENTLVTTAWSMLGRIQDGCTQARAQDAIQLDELNRNKNELKHLRAQQPF